ncbi:MAG: UbiD family decarboxylase [Peptococcaceae bacterium]|jgi:UbiD family decarboxylase|nr:UbiD family decarboxylase [Peptococcaceae bacterium]
MHRNLRSFLAQLKREQELVEIGVAVDPYLELAEIHRRVIAADGPALLFNNVKGSDFPVVTNLFGTRRRVELSVGAQPEKIVQTLVAALPSLLPPRLQDLWQLRDTLKPLTKIGLSQVKPSQAPVLEIHEAEVDLRKLPALTSWPEDGGAFITLPLVYTEDPLTHQHNLGMYRIQLHSAQQTGIHWQIHKGGGFHYDQAEQRGEELPVTLFIGGPPALILSAIAPLPEMLPELIFTSFLMGEKLAMTRQADLRHALVAEAEFAFCGSVPPKIRKAEGPFGDHYGYYSLQHDFPVFNIQSMYRRKDAIYPATVVGKPRQEDYYIGDYLQELLAPLFPVVMPGVKSLWTYGETGFHALTGAVVQERYHREAVVHALRILGEGQLSLTKFLLVTDQNVAPREFKALLQVILERMNPVDDLIILRQTAMDTLDYTGRRLNHGSKAVMLGIGEAKRVLPQEFHADPPPGIDAVMPFCPGCLLLTGKTYEQEPKLAERIARQTNEALLAWPLLILTDDLEPCREVSGFLWQVFTRFDAAYDLSVSAGRILIDARMKPMYPGTVEPDARTVQCVDQRWAEYGIKL